MAHHHHAPPGVHTHAEHALQAYPELLVPGLEKSSQVFALVAESLGQKPSARGRKSKITSAASGGGIKHAALVRHVGSTYQPQGLSSGEKGTQGPSAKTGATSKGSGAKNAVAIPPIDAKAVEKRRKEWVRRLGAVFDFEVTPTPAPASSGTTASSPSPTHFYVDLFSTGIISLTPPAVLRKHSTDSASPTSVWSRRHVITIKISDRDLLAVATGERVPVRLFSEGKLRVKGDIHKALLLGKLLSVTRSQIYADADAESPSHDLYDVHPAKPAILQKERAEERPSAAKDSTGPLRHGDIDAQGLHGQGAPAGGAEWGVGGMRGRDMVRAKL